MRLGCEALFTFEAMSQGAQVGEKVVYVGAPGGRVGSGRG